MCGIHTSSTCADAQKYWRGGFCFLLVWRLQKRGSVVFFFDFCFFFNLLWLRFGGRKGRLVGRDRYTLAVMPGFENEIEVFVQL